MGIISSFVMPTRDSLISHIVSPHEIQRAVTIATGLQFIGQVGGMTFVGLSGIHIGWMPMVQSIALVLAAVATHRLPYHLMPAAVRQTHDVTHRTAQIMDGLRLAFAHREIAPVLIMMLAMSLCYMGTFFVFFPVDRARLLWRRHQRHCAHQCDVFCGHGIFDHGAAARGPY